MDAQAVASPTGPGFGRGLRFGLTGDERLARLVAEGSDPAFSALYARYHQPLYRLCRMLVGNDQDAQDALQSAFTGALVALREGRRDAPLRPWLYRIAHNESISLLRRRRPEAELPAELPHSSNRSAHDVVEDRQRLSSLLADLRELPEQQRSALVMRELSGLSHEEVAAALTISVGAAKQTVLEARRSLAEFSEGRSMSCAEVQRTISDGDRRVLRGRKLRAHLRDCPGCAAFAEAIPRRRADLLALSPALPALAASGLLARITGGLPSHAFGHGGAGLAAGATGAAGKGIGTALSAKMLTAGAVAVVTAAVGGAAVVHHLTASSAPAIPPVVAHATSHLRGAAHHSAVAGRAARHLRGRQARSDTASAASARGARRHGITGGLVSHHRHDHVSPAGNVSASGPVATHVSAGQHTAGGAAATHRHIRAAAPAGPAHRRRAAAQHQHHKPHIRPPAAGHGHSRTIPRGSSGVSGGSRAGGSSTGSTKTTQTSTTSTLGTTAGGAATG